jgi:hypothetical protein
MVSIGGTFSIQQGCPVVFEKFGSILVAGDGGGRRHLRLAELGVIECFQAED